MAASGCGAVCFGRGRVTPEASHVPIGRLLLWTTLQGLPLPKGPHSTSRRPYGGPNLHGSALPVRSGPCGKAGGAGGHIAPSVRWVRPRHWPISCVSKRPDSRNAKALAARVSSAGPTVAIEGSKRDELGLRDYLRGTSTETRLYVPTVVQKHLRLSDERVPARLARVVFAREGCENGEARSDSQSLRASDQSATGVLHG